MKDLKTREKNACELYNLYWDSYIKGDLETFASTLDEAFELIGTSESEVAHNKSEGIEFLKAQLQEVVGKVEMRNRQINLVPIENLMLVNEQCGIYVRTGSEWNFYSKIRISTLLRETKDGWKVTQQHGSLPDMRVQEGETLAIQKINRENLELRDAIKRRTIELEQKNRELEIEAALERVRAIAMGMKKPEDLLDVCQVISNQLEEFGIDQIRNIQIAIIDEKSGLYSCYQFFPAYKQTTIEETEYLKNPVEQEMVHQMLASRDGHFMGHMEGEALREFEAHRKEENHFPDPLIENSSELGYCFLSIGEGGLGITRYKAIKEEELNLFKRFHQVFSLAYQRFRDIQKAEAQARQAQIEAAVERVRAKALAMHKSAEILQVAITLKEQMEGLNLSGITAATIYLEHDDSKIRVWDITELKEAENGPQLSSDFIFRLGDTDPGLWVRRIWNASEKYSVIEMSGDDFIRCEKWIREFDETAADNYREFIKAGKIEHTWHPTVQLEKGKLNLDFTVPPPPEMEFILPKMGAAFDLAYRRFLDLQKAEAQTKEAQIEAALERVRAAGMAMHRSEDLAEASTILFEQLRELGVEARRVGFALPDEEKREFTVWSTIRDDDGKARLLSAFLHYDQHSIYPKMIDNWRTGQNTFGFELHGPELQDYYKAWNKTFKTPDSLRKTIQENESEYYQFATFQQGLIYAFTANPLGGTEHQLLSRFAKAFEQTYTRFLDLQKAEAQARTAQIEASLERIRAKAMAMHHSDELDEVLAVLCEQFDTLGIFPMSTHMTVLDIPNNKFTFRETGKFGNRSFGAQTVALDAMDTWKEMVESWKNADPYSVNRLHFPKETLPQVWEVFHESFASMPEGSKITPADYPDGIYHTAGKHPFGYIGMNQVRPATPEEEQIVIKFASEFGRAYQRFLDLQKAEAQTREAQIEAALERVRSRSMAMHSSSELADLSMELVKQVQNLGMDNWFCAFNIDDGDPQGSLEWGSNGNMVFQAYRTPREGVFLNYYEAGKRGETLLVNEITEEECPAHYDYLCSLPGVGDQLLQMKSAGIPFPTYQIDHVAYFKYGYLLFITYEPVPESHEIFIRFAKVFEQTYTRFLDLQKAEEQAREAQLELSLERIRAQVTAMRESSDLFDIVVGMRKEFISLGHEADYFWHMSWLPDSYEMSMTSEDGNRIGMVISLPKSVHEEYPDLMRWEESKKPSYVMALDAKEAWAYLESMNTYGHYELADPNAPTEADIHQLGGLTFILARTSHGEIGFSLAGKITEPPQASIDILVRFAGVFDLAYKRFEDLKKAEARIREEKVKTSLERVRSRSLAMHQSSELQDVIKTVSDQFKELEIDISGGAFIVINKDLEEGFYCWGAGGVGNYIRKVKVPFIDLPIYTTLSDGIKSRNPFFTEFYGVEEKHTFFRHLFNHEPFINTPAQRQEYLLSLFSGYSRSCVVSDNTSIFIINHEGRPFSNEENEFLKQMGRVFEQAYTRFVDLEKAELQARLISEERDRLEIALNELKTTQAQLIQQEKLASLGQLTAGIAHEIKNPLNFVNNFSDLSRELIEEAFGELEKVESSDAKEEIIAILEDVRSNLTKVYEHGSRADRIVKSMLQHSRASESKRTPQPFNSLVKEFVNLSYHGMRASKSPINVDISLELDPEIGEVSLISEDFSRVILNLCNNAFDAMREKIQTSSPDFHPLLTASSTLENGKILLSIGDNGPGIPEEIKDKILQPFFTTKKGTEGTGLGLSITHDIIKAHGGDLSIKTEIGKGTEFIIQLPSS